MRAALKVLLFVCLIGTGSTAIAGDKGLGEACNVDASCAGSLKCLKNQKVCGCTTDAQCTSKVAPGRPKCRKGTCQK
jgi:hypothetical protein